MNLIDKLKIYSKTFLFRGSTIFSWGRRKKSTSKHQEDSVLENTLHESSDEHEVPRSKIPVKENKEKDKPESRSSSGIGTSSYRSSRKKDGSDEASSRCLSPSWKNENFADMSDGGKLMNDEGKNVSDKKKVENKKIKNSFNENEYSALQNVKDSISKKKSSSKFGLSSTKKNDNNKERYPYLNYSPFIFCYL